MTQLTHEELTQFSDSAARFLADTYAAHPHLSHSGNGGHSSGDLWARYAELGWLALTVPEEYGGLGAGAFELSKLFESAGRHLVLEPLFSTLAIGAPLLAALGSERQKADLLPQVAAGELILAFAHAEGSAGHDRSHVLAKATASGASYRLTGEKSAVLHAEAADRLLVSARTDDSRLEVFLVDPASEGVRLSSYRLVDGRPAANIILDDAEAQLLDGGDADQAVAHVLDLATALLCAETMGIVSALRIATIDYAKSRIQFGRPIASFQVLQHRMVDMLTGEQEAWAVTRCALKAIDAGAPDAFKLVSAAKARVDQVSRFVGEQAIQIHGGIGMSEELIVGHLFKRTILNASLLGDVSWHLQRLVHER